ncbi:MAG: hypothetical protein WBM61_16175, partial [Woeseiaceae bacterium]
TVSVRTHRAHGKVVVRVLAGPPLFGSVFVGHGMPLSWYARIALRKVVVRVLAGPPLFRR